MTATVAAKCYFTFATKPGQKIANFNYSLSSDFNKRKRHLHHLHRRCGVPLVPTLSYRNTVQTKRCVASKFIYYNFTI